MKFTNIYLIKVEIIEYQGLIFDNLNYEWMNVLTGEEYPGNSSIRYSNTIYLQINPKGNPNSKNSKTCVGESQKLLLASKYNLWDRFTKSSHTSKRRKLYRGNLLGRNHIIIQVEIWKNSSESESERKRTMRWWGIRTKNTRQISKKCVINGQWMGNIAQV